jgi:ribosomal protein S18 acetylase RimI-like enzyme
MSLYAQYLMERTDDGIIETEKGFVTYRFINKDQCYIIDIYVAVAHRKSNIATELADRVVSIARTRGCKEIIGTVVPSTKGSNTSLMVLWGYGMKLDSADKNLIIMKKEI